MSDQAPQAQEPQVLQQVPPVAPPPAGKKRHGCFTSWLIFMLIANSYSLLAYLFGDYSDIAGWGLPVFILLLIVNIVAVVMLFKWKKMGFWILCGTTAVTFVVNLAVGLGFGAAISGLLGVPILYGVLNIGKANKGWPQLD